MIRDNAGPAIRANSKESRILLSYFDIRQAVVFDVFVIEFWDCFFVLAIIHQYSSTVEPSPTSYTRAGFSVFDIERIRMEQGLCEQLDSVVTHRPIRNPARIDEIGEIDGFVVIRFLHDVVQ